MSELAKLRNGDFYKFDDPELVRIHYRSVALCQQYNALPIAEEKERDKVLRELFGSVGRNVCVKPNFFCDYGKNIHIGDDFLANYNVTILDNATVTIGNNVWIGPHVGIYAVAHPMDAAGRMKRLGIARPITIGDNVWIGGSAVILMGVTIGNNAVIGAGSVVTHDIPDNAVAVGNPAKVIRYVDNGQDICNETTSKQTD